MARLDPAGSRIQRAAPDFDPRNYGCLNLSTLVTKLVGFEVRKGPDSPVQIRRKAVACKAA